jgi:hypothetical protein
MSTQAGVRTRRGCGQPDHIHFSTLDPAAMVDSFASHVANNNSLESGVFGEKNSRGITFECGSNTIYTSYADECFCKSIAYTVTFLREMLIMQTLMSVETTIADAKYIIQF